MSKPRKSSNAISNVSTGWKTKRLCELAELAGRIGWRGLTAKEYTETGPLFLSVHSLNYGDFVDFRDAFHITQTRYDESPEIMLQSGDILICKDGAGIGKLGIIADLPSQATINSSLLMIRPGQSILPKYLYHCLSSPYFQQIVLSRLNGATTPHLYQRDINDFPVHFPSLDEQERITAVLDEAFEGIATAKASTEANLQNVRNVFLCQLHKLFSEAWQAAEVVKLATLATDITDGDHMPPPKSIDGVPFVTISNIDKQTHEIDFSETYFVSREYFESLKPNKRPRKGDLLYTVTGSFGIPVKVEDEFEFCFQRHIGLIRPKSDVSTSWLYYLVRSPQVSQQASEKATGTAQRTVSLSALRNFSVPKLGLTDQQAMASKLDKLHVETKHLEEIYTSKLLALDELKQSLLHQAFSGNL